MIYSIYVDIRKMFVDNFARYLEEVFVWRNVAMILAFVWMNPQDGDSEHS